MTNLAPSAGLLIPMTSILTDIDDYDRLRTGCVGKHCLCLMNWCEKAGRALGALGRGLESGSVWRV